MIMAGKEIYSVRVLFEGKERILSLIVDNGINLVLTDLNGNVLEYVKQEGNTVEFTPVA